MRALVLLVLLVTACADDAAGPTTLDLTLSSTAPMTFATETRELRADVRDGDGDLVPGAALTFASSDPAVASVAPHVDGARITAIADGSATITARSGDATAQVTVTVHRLAVSVEVIQPAPLPFGGTAQLAAVARDAGGAPVAVDFGYASSNPRTVMVSPAGEVLALFACCEATRATVTASARAGDRTLEASAEITVREEPTFTHAAVLLSENVRPTPAPTTGSAIALFTVVGARVDYRIVWSELSAPATTAHLHVGGEVLDLALDAQDRRFGVTTGTLTASEALLGQLDAGAVSVDLHSAELPGGEIAGVVNRAPS